ncbi:MAG TPA: AAA family ATPase [Acidimicrobiales bacterium]|nr:AAA family ATPase [Acidimicrobiales bacterium]
MAKGALGFAALAGAVGVGMALAGVGAEARTVLVLLFLAVVPTAAIAGFLPGLGPLARVVVAATANVVLLALVSMAMLAEGVWSPSRALLLVGVVTADLFIVQFPPVKQHVLSWARSWGATLERRVPLLAAGPPVREQRPGAGLLRGFRGTVLAPEEGRAGSDGKAMTSNGGGRLTEAQVVEQSRSAFLHRLSQPSSWAPLDGDNVDDVMRREVGEMQPSVFVRDDGVALLYRRRLNVFRGEPQSGKSWAALVAVVQQVRAGNVVCVLDFQDAFESMVDRLRQLGLTRQQIVAQVICCSPDSPFNEIAQAHLENEFHARCHVPEATRELSLVVVNDLTGAMAVEDLDPANDGEVARFFGGFPRWLKHLGAAVVLVQHDPGPADPGARGGAGLDAGVGRVDGAVYGFKESAPFGRGLTGRARVSLLRDGGGYLRREAPGRVVGTLTLTSPAGGETVGVTFSAAGEGRPARRRVPSRQLPRAGARSED